MLLNMVTEGTCQQERPAPRDQEVSMQTMTAVELTSTVMDGDTGIHTWKAVAR